jgi:ornithine carbamoyltransferase
MQKDLLTFKGWSKQEVNQLLVTALNVKASPQEYAHVLKGKSIVALFEKPSLRTRVSFDIGINKLGGHMVYLDSQAGKLAGRESIKDMAGNLSCWADGIIARVFSHNTILDLADNANVPVINALCDWFHPCQGLADYLTLKEQFANLENVKLAYVGDGNNVTHSLMILGAILGCEIIVVTPKGYEPDDTIVSYAQGENDISGGKLVVTNDLKALSGVDVIYTDTWLSMGDDTPLETIKSIFMPYQVNQKMLDQSGAKYILHCQPAHRDLEITSEVIDGKQSLLMAQAENRMHAQNAILMNLLA